MNNETKTAEQKEILSFADFMDATKEVQTSKLTGTERLQNMFSLKSKVTVYVPSTTDIDREVDTRHYIDTVASLLSSCFGGATSTPCIGYWNSDTKGLVKEKTTQVFAYADTESLERHLDSIIDYCVVMKETLKQDAIAFELNNQMYFI